MEIAALRAEAAAAAKGKSAQGLVKFSIGPTLAAYWIMPHMGPFVESHPGIQLEFVTHPSLSASGDVKRISSCASIKPATKI